MRKSCFLLSLLVGWAAAAVEAPAAACVAVVTDRILGRDLAAARRDFAALDAGAEIGFSPRPGVTRVFQPSELVTLARKYGLTVTGRLESVCFVRPASAAAAVQKPATPPFEVLRGEQVSVEVTSGAALLRFQAAAETSGRAGDSVLIRNPENGKLFQARVESMGKVIVQR
jgi:hypothetical protein